METITWNQIIGIAGITIVALGILYKLYFQKASDVLLLEQTKITVGMWTALGGVLLAGLVFRLFMAYNCEGYLTDMNLFKAWGKQMMENGLSSAYNSETFVDYPPGYLAVLGLLERLVRLFGVQDAMAQTTGITSVIYRMPACLCDLVTGWFVFKIAREKLPTDVSLFLVIAYIFHPAVILNSAVWGQVDGVYTLIVVIMLYFITKKKLPIAYFVCVAGVLIKPQMMFFAPILIWAIVEQVFLQDFHWKKFWINLGTGILSLLFGLCCMIPFGIGRTIRQYTDTLGSYEYATVNAANFWGAIGKNWVEQSQTYFGLSAKTWGSLFLVLAVAGTIFLCWKLRKEESKYFIAGACMMTAIFTFSVRMHERYLFPAMLLLVIAFAMRPAKRMFLAYGALSVVHFLNVAFVYMIGPEYKGYTGSTMPEFVIMSVLQVIVFAYLLYVVLREYPILKKNKDEMKGEKELVETNLKKEEIPKKTGFYEGIMRSKKLGKIEKIDILLMIAIVCIYGAVALYNLGDTEGETPNTEYYSEWYSLDGETVYPSITLDMGEDSTVSGIAYYLGNYEKRQFTVETADSLNGPWTNQGECVMESVFCWGQYDLYTVSRYIRLTAKNNAISLFELVVLGAENNILQPLNAQEYENLFDENQTYDVRKASNGTYFDEIYHARTAYEYLQGRYSYENTHPPLGKCFIAIGMLIFGVCPFGWRIMGVLFGIAMLPFIYLFMKRMMNKTWLSTCVTLLFAFDFMHFTQTRIATIDVFVTFFIIGMYYFMYQYVSMSFYDQPLRYTFIPLGCSGVLMGFGVASKWTGAYAGVGLAVLFFMSLFRRFMEYRYAKKDVEGETNGISHKEVVQKFVPYTLKTIAFCIVFFVLIPFCIYTLSYLPFRDGSEDGLIVQMLRNQESMFHYHSELKSTHPYASVWYNWPTMYRPIWYYSREVSDTVAEGISAFGNPLVWWVGIAAAVYMVYLIIKNKDKNAIFLFVAYMAQYLPWCLVSRTTYIYHYFPSVPFIVLMIGYAISRIVGENPRRRRVAYVYVAAAIGLFVLFYPVLSGYPVNKAFVTEHLRWFDTWVLISG